MGREKLVYICFCLALLVIIYIVLGNHVLKQDYSVNVFQRIWISSSENVIIDTPIDNHHEEENLSCQFPKIDPFGAEIKPFIEHPRSFGCKRVQDEFSYVNNEGNVRLNSEAIASREKQEQTNLICYWKHISKGKGHKNKVVESQYEVFSLNASVKFSKSGIVQVSCYKHGKRIYFNLHVVPQPLQKPLHPPTESELSVYVLIFESMSTARFKRHMTSFQQTLKEMDGFQFEGYSKVAENTFVNLVPMFTGMRANKGDHNMADEFHKKHKNIESYDDVDDFIWKKFAKKSNYSTAFIENAAKISTFEYNQKKGFKSIRPFDYYYRPFFIKQERLLKYSSKFCFGNYPVFDTQLNITQQIFQKYGNSQKLFAINCIVKPGHDEENDIERADETLAKSFTSLYRSGALNKTLLFVMGDHGPRFGQTRATKNGYFEERLTYSSIVLPKWFLKKYPLIKTNLILNKNRLTTPFDIHETLQQILEGSFDDLSTKPSRGISLFKEIPKTRTCSLAGIPQFYCPCFKNVVISKDSKLVENLAMAVVSKINERLTVRKFHTKCAKLKLDKILQASELFGNIQKSKDIKKIKLIIRTKPGKGTFESVAIHNMTSGETTFIDGMSRLNKYGRHGRCIKSGFEKYCYCKEFLN